MEELYICTFHDWLNLLSDEVFLPQNFGIPGYDVKALQATKTNCFVIYWNSLIPYFKSQKPFSHLFDKYFWGLEANK